VCVWRRPLTSGRSAAELERRVDRVVRQPGGAAFSSGYVTKDESARAVVRARAGRAGGVGGPDHREPARTDRHEHGGHHHGGPAGGGAAGGGGAGQCPAPHRPDDGDGCGDGDGAAGEPGVRCGRPWRVPSRVRAGLVVCAAAEPAGGVLFPLRRAAGSAAGAGPGGVGADGRVSAGAGAGDSAGAAVHCGAAVSGGDGSCDGADDRDVPGSTAWAT
jgi:hypothetical protein